MQRVVVTIKREDEPRVRDIEVPADVEVERLSDLIARALHWDNDPTGEPVRYEIQAHPLGRALKPHESLVSAGVWDGAWLVMYPIKAATPAVETVSLPPELVTLPGTQPEMAVAAQAPIEAEPAPTLEQPISVQQPQTAPVVEPVDQTPMPAFVEVMPPQQEAQPGEPLPIETATQYAQPFPVQETETAPLGQESEEPYDLEALLAGTAPSTATDTPVAQASPPYTPPPLASEPYPPASNFGTAANTDTRPSSELVSGWRGLGISLPLQSADDETEQEEKPSGGFVWKQLSD